MFTVRHFISSDFTSPRQRQVNERDGLQHCGLAFELPILSRLPMTRSDHVLLLATWAGAGLRASERGPAIKSDDNHLRALPSRGSRSSRGSIVHNLPGGVRLRESAGAIELLGDSRDEALEQLARFAEQRFGGRRVTLLGSRSAQKRLAELAAERGLDIAEERER